MSNQFHHSIANHNIGTILMLKINQMILKPRYWQRKKSISLNLQKYMLTKTEV